MTLEVVLYTRRLCGLCDEAAEALARLSRELNFAVSTLDIDEDAGLRERYNDVVPVIEANGNIIARAPIDEQALRDALRSALDAEK